MRGCSVKPNNTCTHLPPLSAHTTTGVQWDSAVPDPHGPGCARRLWTCTNRQKKFTLLFTPIHGLVSGVHSPPPTTIPSREGERKQYLLWAVISDSALIFVLRTKITFSCWGCWVCQRSWNVSEEAGRLIGSWNQDVLTSPSRYIIIGRIACTRM